MEYSHLFRRGFHLSAPLILLYYWVPETFLWLPKFWWVLIVLALILVLEAVRISTGFVVFGYRDYERNRLSAFAWAGMGVTLAIYFFPPIFVFCSVVGMAWTDPLIGELRKQKRMEYYPGLPLLVYSLIVVGCLAIFSDFGCVAIGILGAVGSATAIAIERPKLPVDDDFLMLVIPLFVLTVFYEYLLILGWVG